MTNDRLDQRYSEDLNLGLPTLDCTLPPCPSGKEYGFTSTDVGNALCKMIRDHGFPCRLEADGMIRAASHYINPRTQVWSWRISAVKPTLTAVREWLGY